MAELKNMPWQQRDRNSKLASVLYPDLADEDTRKQMDEISAREGKRSPTKRKKKKFLSDAQRLHVSPMGGQARGSGKLAVDEE
jgi:hypothetical protein